jgi:hypothetical protein
MAIGMLYPPLQEPLGDPDKLSNLGYWFYSVDKLLTDNPANLQNLLNDGELYEKTNSFQFDTYSQNSLVITYDAQPGQCLWVINPEDKGNSEIPYITDRISTISNVDLISDTQNPGYPAKSIFGGEPKHTWCYYFEKAELDRQTGKWDDVQSLWKAAQQGGYKPQVGFEFNPFIISMAHLDQWNTARQMTEQASKMDSGLNPYLCSLWQRLDTETTPNSDRDVAVRGVDDEFECNQPK